VNSADVLRAVARWPRDLRDDWEERAALIEDGCKVSREESERRAFELLKHRVPLKTQGKLF
jgi:hypothetical protein